jgi:hypothetical protein
MKATAFNNIIVVGAALCVAPTLAQTPQFKAMGKAPGGIYGPYEWMIIHGITDSGEVFGFCNGTAVVWTPGVGYQQLKSLVPDTGAGIGASSADGSVLCGASASEAGNNKPSIPVLWKDRELPPEPIPGFPGGGWSGGIECCNSDGSVVSGTMYQLGTGKHGMFIWRKGVRKNKGWEFIYEWPPGFVYGGLTDLSADGTIGVGAGPDATLEGFQGLLWRKPGGFQVVPDLPGGITDCSLMACDATGFRGSNWASPAEEMWIAGLWEPVNGWSLIGKMKPSHTGSSLLIADCGFSGMGTSGFHISNDRTAFAWNARDGMRSVEDVLVQDHGLIEVSPWQLTDVDAISSNGRFIVGRSKYPPLNSENWWAEIKPFCYADCDNSTSPKGKDAGPPVLDIDDFICFQTKFAIGDYLYADCDLDGYLTIDDYLCFQTKFALGCP